MTRILTIIVRFDQVAGLEDFHNKSGFRTLYGPRKSPRRCTCQQEIVAAVSFIQYLDGQIDSANTQKVGCCVPYLVSP